MLKAGWWKVSHTRYFRTGYQTDSGRSNELLLHKIQPLQEQKLTLKNEQNHGGIAMQYSVAFNIHKIVVYVHSEVKFRYML